MKASKGFACISAALIITAAPALAAEDIDSALTTVTRLRLGVRANLELQLEADRNVRATFRDPVTGDETQDSGLSAFSTAVKWHVADGDGIRPSVALVVQGDIEPAWRAPFKGEGVRPSLRTTLDWRLTHDASLSAMPGLVYDKTDGRRHASGMLGVALGKAWTPTFRTYIEAAAERIASARKGGSTVTYNLGGVYLLREAMQIDSALSWPANSDTPDLAWTVGLSMKF
jgi:hypothetical protein